MAIATIDNRVRQVISNIRNLPTPPIVFHQIQKVINDPHVSAAQIAGILSEDPAMSVKVLKLTNSAFYGLTREVESVKQAVVVVGMEAIKNLILSASVLDMFKGDEFDQEYQEKFWRHSLAVGFCARLLARKVRSRAVIDPDAGFSAGLLHDVGKNILCCFLRKEYEIFSEARAKDRESPTHEIEEQVLGYNHAQLGAVLAEQWKLPERLMQAIGYHHHPQLSENDDALAFYVHVANHLAKVTFYENEDRYLIGHLGAGVLDYLQIEEADMQAHCEALREEYLKAETFMKMVGIA
ncbi:MAG TPA: HDOD domain-containing protein [Acidobacteriota bacterium]|nr:HDOD domain-containing protein [Acidobacteriota bacterium]